MGQERGCAAMSFILKDRLELHMGPASLGAPDDLEAAIVGFIDEAKETLDVAVQEIESRPIAEALVRARQRGVRIRLVLEQRSEEHTSELQSLMRNSYAVFCL